MAPTTRQPKLDNVDQEINKVVASLEKLSTAAPKLRSLGTNESPEAAGFRQKEQQPSDVRAALQQLKIKVSTEDQDLDAQLASARLDLDQKHARSKRANRGKRSGSGGGPRPNERIVEDIRSSFRNQHARDKEYYRGSHLPGPKSVKQLMTPFESKATGTVTVQSFTEMLRNARVLLSAQEQEAFVDFVDPSGKGVINVAEFSDLVEKNPTLVFGEKSTSSNSSSGGGSGSGEPSMEPSKSKYSRTSRVVEGVVGKDELENPQEALNDESEAKRQKLRDALQTEEEKAGLRLEAKNRSRDRAMNTIMHHLGGVTDPLRARLRRHDASNSGHLTAAELGDALSSFGIPMEDAQIEGLASSFLAHEEHPMFSSGRIAVRSNHTAGQVNHRKQDKSRYQRHMRSNYAATQLVDYEAILNKMDDDFENHAETERAAKQTKRSEPPRAIRKLWRTIERAGGVDNECWSRAFVSMDPSNSGTVSSDVLPTVLASLGVTLTDRELGTVLSIVDPVKSGRINYDDVQANATRRVAMLDLAKAEDTQEATKTHRRGRTMQSSLTLAQLVREEPGRTKARVIAKRTTRRLKDLVDRNGDAVAAAVSALEESSAKCEEVLAGGSGESECGSGAARRDASLTLQQLKNGLLNSGLHLSDQDVAVLAEEATHRGTGEGMSLSKFLKAHNIGSERRPRVQFLSGLGAASNENETEKFKTTTEPLEQRSVRRLSGQGMCRRPSSFSLQSMYAANADGSDVQESLRPSVSMDDLQVGSSSSQRWGMRRHYARREQAGFRSRSVPPQRRQRAAASPRASEASVFPAYMHQANPELRAFYQRGAAAATSSSSSSSAAAATRSAAAAEGEPGRVSTARLTVRKVAPNGPQALVNSHLVGGAAPMAAAPQRSRSSSSSRAAAAQSEVVTPTTRAFATLSDIANGGSGGGSRMTSLAQLTGFSNRPASASASLNSRPVSRASSRAATPNLDQYVAGSVSRSSTPRSDANRAPTPSHSALSRPAGSTTTPGGGGGNQTFFAQPVPVKDTPPPANNARKPPTPPQPQEP